MLERTIEEARQNGKVELNRLRGLHEAELREKDRQILVFRQELDSIMEGVCGVVKVH